MTERVRITKLRVNRLHLIIKIGVILCIVLVIAVGITSILIISEMTDIASLIANLNDLGFRRTLSIQATMASKRQLLLDSSTDGQTLPFA
jgi:hypothetical protein